MEDTLLTLHGEAHRTRRMLEFRVFRRSFFRWYETESSRARWPKCSADGRATGAAT